MPSIGCQSASASTPRGGLPWRGAQAPMAWAWQHGRRAQVRGRDIARGALRPSNARVPASSPRSALFADGRSRVLWFCLLGWIFDLHDLVLFSFTKGLVARDLGMSLSTLAWIEGAGLFASALGGAAFGLFADRYGRRRAMSLSILTFSLGALLTSAAQGPATLLAARLLAGLAVGGEWGIGHAVVAAHWHGPDRDRAHGILQAASPIGVGLAAATGLFLAPALGWRVAFLLSATPAVLAALARWAMPGADLPPAAPKEGPSLRQLFAAGRLRTTACLFLILLLHMTGFWCVGVELPAGLMRDRSASASVAGGFQLSINAVHVLSDLGFGLLAARYGSRRMFVLFCLLYAGAQAGAALWWPSLAGSFTACLGLALVLGLFAGTWSWFGAAFGRLYPPWLCATAASLLYSCSRGAQLFAKPWSQSLVADHGSLAPLLWIGGGCALGSLVLSLGLPGDRRDDPSA